MKSAVLPYVPQPDELTCQAACCAQVVGVTEVGRVRRILVESGRGMNPPQAAGSPLVMGEYLKPRVVSYRFSPKASIAEVREFLSGRTKLQRVCILHGWFTPSGHVINVRGESDQDTASFPKWIVDDPYREFNFVSWRFMNNQTGDNVHYSELGIYAACVASEDEKSAREIYQRRQVDIYEKNMWCHFVEN